MASRKKMTWLNKFHLLDRFIWIKYDRDLRPTLVIFSSKEPNNFSDILPSSSEELSYFGFFFYRDTNNGNRIVRAEYISEPGTSEIHYKETELTKEEMKWKLNLARYHKVLGLDPKKIDGKSLEEIL